eukprot:gene24267-29339_t
MKHLTDAVLSFSNRQGYAAIPQADEENMPDNEVLTAFSHTPSPPLPYTASSPATQQNEVDGVAVGEAVLGRSSMFSECHSKCDEKEACGFWTSKHGERRCCRWFYPSQGGQTCSLSVSKNAKGEEECRCMNEIIRTYGGEEPKGEKSPSMQPHPASSKTDESAAGDYYKHLYAGQYLPPTPSTPTTPATTTTSTSTSTTPNSDNNQVPSLSPTVVPRPPWMNYLPTSPGDAPSSSSYSAAGSWLNYMPSPPSPNDTPAPWGIHLPPYLQPTVKPSDGSSATSASTSAASTGALIPGDPVAAAASAQAAAAAAQAAAASASVLPSTVSQPAAASVDTSAVNAPSTVNNEANPANNANNAEVAPQRGVSMDINLNVDIIKEVAKDVVQRGIDTVNSAEIKESKENKENKERNRKESAGFDGDLDGDVEKANKLRKSLSASHN